MTLTAKFPDGRVLEYATEEEVLAFARKLRAAGGGPLLDGLMPSERSSADSCLIANALNFNCNVFPAIYSDYSSGAWKWMMTAENVDLAYLAAVVDCKIIHDEYRSGILLPEKIGNAAHAFDFGIGWTAKYGRTNDDID